MLLGLFVRSWIEQLVGSSADLCSSPLGIVRFVIGIANYAAPAELVVAVDTEFVVKTDKQCLAARFHRCDAATPHLFFAGLERTEGE